MNNENTPNINKLLKAGDNIIGSGMGALGCFTIVFFGLLPLITIVYLVGTKIFGLPG